MAATAARLGWPKVRELRSQEIGTGPAAVVVAALFFFPHLRLLRASTGAITAFPPRRTTPTARRWGNRARWVRISRLTKLPARSLERNARVRAWRSPMPGHPVSFLQATRLLILKR